MPRVAWLLALASCLAGACTREDSNTKIMVVVWSDLAVPTELDRVGIDVKGPTTSSSRSFSLSTVSAPGKAQLPIVYQLVSPDDQDRAFEVTATGYRDASPLVSQSAHLSFEPGHTRVLSLLLGRACVPISCAADKTCSDGLCDRPVAVDVAGLPTYDPKAPWVAPDAGPVVGRDADVSDTTDVRDRLDGADAQDAAPDLPPDVPMDLLTASDSEASDTEARSDGAVPDMALAMDALDTATMTDAGGDLAFRDVATDLRIPAPDSATVEVSPDAGPDTCNASSDPAHCGACGHACSTNSGVPACTVGRCSMASCAPGYLDCSDDEDTSRDGCETHGAVDPNNCGRCGNDCTSKVCREGTCLASATYGNTGPGVSSVNFTGDYLAGIQVYVPNASVVTGIGAVLFGATAGRSMYLGLYSDVAGNPASLVATLAGPVSVSSGGQEFDVSPAPVDIAKGNYWILGVWDQTASFASNTGTTVTWRYASRAMGPLPQTAPTSMASTSLAPPNLFIRVAQ